MSAQSQKVPTNSPAKSAFAENNDRTRMIVANYTRVLLGVSHQARSSSANQACRKSG